ncbi:hypothetical protein FHR23_002624 [Stakelama sediminis]|uniref:Uncharacterized protein n=1 Tax=Stakelama sediminis TaxID=463200 RepID=A0A840Z1T7_9SPHN|nr:hypothetical protein [Stakelama sediminis]
MSETLEPDAEKRRAKSRRNDMSLRRVLLRPSTWKALTLALNFCLKLAHLAAKAWEMIM